MAMDLREYWENPEEALRALLDGARKEMHTALPVIVSEDADGHTAKLQISVKAREFDKDGNLSHVEFPLLQDVPIHFPQGGGAVHTFPIKKGDEGFVVFSSRAFDAWHQSGGVQQTVDVRTHSLSDGMFVPGHRSDPRKVPNNSTTEAHVRSDDGKHTVALDPKGGIHVKSVDPSDNASDPYNAASKYVESFVNQTNQILHNATDGSTTHAAGVTHEAGAFMSALNKLHQVLAHPNLGALLSAAGGQHLVQAHPTSGVMIQSPVALAIQAATSIAGGLTADSVQGQSGSFGSLSVPGGIGAAGGGAPLASGAASQNVGTLSGDLAGTLPSPTVVGITHIANANTLPVAANDAAAAALTPPVAVGGLYVNQTAISGQNLLCVRMA